MSYYTTDADGNKRWHNAAEELHREDGPAIERVDGHKAWWLNNQRHREDGPAVEDANGDRLWYQRHLLHREDGPAIEAADGTLLWWIAHLPITQAQFDALPRDADGRLHSNTGPLVETEDDRCWFWHGEHVTEVAFEALCTAQRVMQGLGDVMESQAPQRLRQRHPGSAI